MKGTPGSLDTLLWVYHFHSSTEVRLRQRPRPRMTLQDPLGRSPAPPAPGLSPDNSTVLAPSPGGPPAPASVFPGTRSDRGPRISGAEIRGAEVPGAARAGKAARPRAHPGPGAERSRGQCPEFRRHLVGDLSPVAAAGGTATTWRRQQPGPSLRRRGSGSSAGPGRPGRGAGGSTSGGCGWREHPPPPPRGTAMPVWTESAGVRLIPATMAAPAGPGTPKGTEILRRPQSGVQQQGRGCGTGDSTTVLAPARVQIKPWRGQDCQSPQSPLVFAPPLS